MIVVIIVASFALSGKGESSFDFVTIEKSTLEQTVNVTGRVKPVEHLDLAFEKGGKVNQVNVKVGDTVSPGAILVTLDNAEITSQLAEKEADLEKQQATLQELEQGTRVEELEVASTKVENAQKELVDDEINLQNVKSKAAVDLDKLYDEAVALADNSVTVSENALFNITDLQAVHFDDSSQESTQVVQGKAMAVYLLLGREDGGRLSKNVLSISDGGAKGDVKKAKEEPTAENIEYCLTRIKEALQAVKAALDIIPISRLTSSEYTNLNVQRSSINDEISTIVSKQKSIEVQKITNEKNIATAESQITDAQNTLLLAEKELKLKEAGATKEQIAIQKAQVAAAKANVNYLEAQLQKTILRSPIAAVVTKQEAKKGEIITAGQSIVSLISKNQFEVEANVVESDIAKIKIGNEAHITFDAFGGDFVLGAKISKIAPAETMLEGVATYKITLSFDEESEIIKSGMTTDINILTAQLSDVIVVPQRAIIKKDSKKYVRVLEAGDIREVRVETGLKGSTGEIEIINGLKVGDRVITYGSD